MSNKRRLGAERSEQTEQETPRKKARSSCKPESVRVVEDQSQPPPNPGEASSKPGPDQMESNPKGSILNFLKANESKAKPGVQFCSEKATQKGGSLIANNNLELIGKIGQVKRASLVNQSL